MRHPYDHLREVARFLGVTSMQIDPNPPSGITRAATVHFGGCLYLYQLDGDHTVYVDCHSARALKDVQAKLAHVLSGTDGRTVAVPDPYALQTLFKGA